MVKRHDPEEEEEEEGWISVATTEEKEEKEERRYPHPKEKRNKNEVADDAVYSSPFSYQQDERRGGGGKRGMPTAEKEEARGGGDVGEEEEEDDEDAEKESLLSCGGSRDGKFLSSKKTPLYIFGNFGPVWVFVLAVILALLILFLTNPPAPNTRWFYGKCLLVGFLFMLFAMIAEWTFLGSYLKKVAFKNGNGSLRPKFKGQALTLETTGMPSAHIATTMCMFMMGTAILVMLLVTIRARVVAWILALVVFVICAIVFVCIVFKQRKAYGFHSKKQLFAGIASGGLTSLLWVGVLVGLYMIFVYPKSLGRNKT